LIYCMHVLLLISSAVLFGIEAHLFSWQNTELQPFGLKPKKISGLDRPFGRAMR
jgi:hypothetical protein